MVDQARLGAGEVVLVHAAGSGVGSAAVQLAVAIGARVIGSARTAAKLEQARALGLAEGFVAGAEPWAPRVLELTGGRGVDVVADLVGGRYVAQDIECLAMRGRIVVIGTLAGARADVDLGTLMHKRAELRGTVLAARPAEEKIIAIRRFERHVVPLLARGAVRPVIDRVVPLANAADAHRHLEANASFGKIVLAVPD